MLFSPFPCYLVPLRPKYSPQHPILNHGTYTHVISFTPTKKIAAHFASDAMKLKNVERHCAHIYVDFHQNRKINLANTHRNSFKPLNGAWFRLCRFPWSWLSLNKFLWVFRTKNVPKSDEKCRKMSPKFHLHPLLR